MTRKAKIALEAQEAIVKDHKDGLTQKELADKLSVHASMVTRWERGQIYPRDRTLESIAAALNLGVEELLSLKASQAVSSALVADDKELQGCLELLARMGDEDRRVVKHLIQALAFRHQVQSLAG